MKKLLTLLLALLLVCGLTACSGGNGGEGGSDEPTAALSPGDTIGVSLNAQSSERWQRDAKTIREAIEGAGYECLMQFNDSNAAVQVTQIQNMVAAGAKVIIVCPYDAGALNAVLKEAREAGVLIINYDLAVTGTPDVDYFVGYDNRQVGYIQADKIIKALDLDNATPDNPKYIEMFAGDLKEANCWYYFNNAMERLQPYFDSGVLVCKSGETDINVCTCVDWDLVILENKLNARIASYYSDGTRLDAVLCPSDYYVQPVSNILRGFGYGTEELPMAYITGNDAYNSVCNLIVHDLAGMTVLKDTRLLSDACMKIIDAYAKGEKVEGLAEYKPSDDYDFVLPTIFVEMFALDKDNMKELVTDTGFYTYESVYGDLVE